MRKRCKEYVYHRDVYRRTGRGPSGFTMHYNREQCKRKAKENGYCWQHPWSEFRAKQIERP